MWLLAQLSSTVGAEEKIPPVFTPYSVGPFHSLSLDAWSNAVSPSTE